ncbi:MAG: bifunctional glutamate N-acetyltransferase/amino-acid acetyltransferase ArgJ [Hahellaceae bacterium]|nr:bifunctional glutamate N-acetyltransferase/amino-acid acetyltransferase ArgJ [Hahellaceae bacterium]
MPVGDVSLPEFHPIPGIRVGIASAGIKKVGRKDITVFALAEGASVAGVFTTNAFCAAPVTLAKQHLAAMAPRYLLINTGNANAGTGSKGLAAAQESCRFLAEQAGCVTEAVLPFSTGVIGELLPVDKVTAAIPQALAQLQDNGWADAASAIMTTDTVPKGASIRIQTPRGVVSLSGISKGAGMICPNMATMLSFVGTDARISPELLQRLLSESVDQSFNRITIDGDTSTNDACILVASGQGIEITEHDSETLSFFRRGLNSLMQRLATLIVRDGEGATKFITVAVEGAVDRSEALAVAYTVAHSPLVKTAFFASDPNWGRILAAIGRSGVANLDVSQISIWLDEACIVEGGARAAAYTEEQGQTVMNRAEITIRIALARGTHEERVWTTDLSHDYVTINAEYRT